MQTGQPGPMMTFRSGGNDARRPNFAIACSWLPHTCITETGDRPMRAVARASASLSACACRLSRNSSGIDLSAHVVRHQIGLVGFLEDLVVHRQRPLHVLLRNAADGEADVVQDV